MGLPVRKQQTPYHAQSQKSQRTLFFLLILFFSSQDNIDMALEGVEVFIDRLPQCVRVNVEISVGKNCAHTNNITPGYLWMLFPELWELTCNRTCCLANNVKVVNHPSLYQFIMIESVSPILGIFHN